MRVRILGMGAIGSRVALHAVECGHEVVGVDVNQSRLDELAAGVGDDAAQVLAEFVGGLLTLSAFPDQGAFDATIICVGTWDEVGGLVDRSVRSALSSLAPHISVGELISIESSLPPGTTERVLTPLLQSATGMEVGADFYLATSPERIDVTIGRPITEIPKIVGGVTPRCAVVAKNLYKSLHIPVVTVSSPSAAESVKLLENAFRLVNISFVNEAALVFSELGVDVREVVDAAATKPFGFLPFAPSAGAGGHCIPAAGKALARLAETLGQDAPLVAAANRVNADQPDVIKRRLVRNGVEPGDRVLVLGSAYKSGVSEMCESPGLRVAAHLTEAGYDVSVYDPEVSGTFGGQPIDRRATVAGAAFDATVIVVWQEAMRGLGNEATLGEIIDFSQKVDELFVEEAEEPARLVALSKVS